MSDRIAMVDMELAHSVACSPTGTDSRAHVARLKAELQQILDERARTPFPHLHDPAPVQTVSPFFGIMPAPPPEPFSLGPPMKTWWQRRDEIQAEIDALHARGTPAGGFAWQGHDRTPTDSAVATIADREGYAIVVDTCTTFYRGSATDITPLVTELLRAGL